ncbi:MAG: glycosyltransferase [Prevotella sp.]|nr:glycosyltransferase [Prevotella sp.]
MASANKENSRSQDKISVVTVVFNDVKNIRRTIESCLAQTWPNKEYIIIDGGSNDGTRDIIAEYAGSLAYWVSEPDNGMYDALNKAAAKATGDWVSVLNSGDVFSNPQTLETVLACDIGNADFVYGNAIEVSSSGRIRKPAAPPERMEYTPSYRHGASLVRLSVQRRFPYDLTKTKQLGYALDWEMMHRAYKAGCRFLRVDIDIEDYEKEGMSNHPYLNQWYNYLITSGGRFSLRHFLFFIKQIAWHVVKDTAPYIWLKRQLTRRKVQ